MPLRVCLVRLEISEKGTSVCSECGPNFKRRTGREVGGKARVEVHRNRSLPTYTAPRLTQDMPQTTLGRFVMLVKPPHTSPSHRDALCFDLLPAIFRLPSRSYAHGSPCRFGTWRRQATTCSSALQPHGALELGRVRHERVLLHRSGKVLVGCPGSPQRRCMGIIPFSS